ncbi:MAG: FAD-binding protein [Oscillospiraceae bacterium]
MADLLKDNTIYQWPYELRYDKVNRVSVDVLVIGGGHAGCCAGIQAARRGSRVAVVDKAPIKRSGCGGAGQDHWNTILDNPYSPMSPEENAERAISGGALQGHREYIAVKGTWDALLKLEEMGLPIRDRDGYFRGAETYHEESGLLKAYDYKNLVAVKLMGGHYIKPVLYEELRRCGARLFQRVMVTALLTENGVQGARAVGAVGFSMETGEFYVFQAKSVILTTGYACSMWIFSTEITGNSFRWDPNEVGEGLAMAWKAGARVYGMWRAGSNSGSHPFAWPRFGVGNPYNTWFPCTIVDDDGKVIPWEDGDGNLITDLSARNHPTANQPYIASAKSDNLRQARCPRLIHDLPERIRAGEFRQPFWADLSSMPEAERRSIWGVMVGNEGKSRYTLYDYYTRNGFDPDTDMLWCPIMRPESFRSSAWFHGEPNIVKPWRTENDGQGEIAVDWDLMTSVPGLFCAGAASGLEGCSFACSSGFYVGDRAHEYAARTEQGALSREQVRQERERVYAPVKRLPDRGAYISWKELWGGTARVMQSCCNEYRTVSTLREGLRWLDSIEKSEYTLTYARNPHELARVLECGTRLTVSGIFMEACIAKIKAEERGEDDESFQFSRLQAGRVVTETGEKDYWLKPPYRNDYLENYRLHTAGEKE